METLSPEEIRAEYFRLVREADALYTQMYNLRRRHFQSMGMGYGRQMSLGPAAAARMSELTRARARLRSQARALSKKHGLGNPRGARTQTYRGMVLTNRTGRSNDWFVSFGGRVRWGTLPQVKADADHVIAYGRLPERARSFNPTQAQALLLSRAAWTRREAERVARRHGRGLETRRGYYHIRLRDPVRLYRQGWRFRMKDAGSGVKVIVAARGRRR